MRSTTDETVSLSQLNKKRVVQKILFDVSIVPACLGTNLDVKELFYSTEISSLNDLSKIIRLILRKIEVSALVGDKFVYIALTLSNDND